MWKAVLESSASASSTYSTNWAESMGFDVRVPLRAESRVGEPGEGVHSGARNLLRAGFRLVDVRSVWRPPEELVFPNGGRLPSV